MIRRTEHRALALIVLLTSSCAPTDVGYRPLPEWSSFVRALIVVARSSDSRAQVRAIDAELLDSGEESLVLTDVDDQTTITVLAYPHPLKRLYLSPGPLSEGTAAEPTRSIPEPLESFVLPAGATEWQQTDTFPAAIRGMRVALAPSPDTGRVLRTIGAGLNFSCAVGSNGEVWCWGRNKDGESGSESPRVIRTATPVDGLLDVVELRGGNRFACARSRSGEVRCWGADSAGQLGRGPRPGIGYQPQPVVGIDDAVEIAVGSSHACALRPSGQVLCWGANRKEFGPVSPDVKYDVVEPMVVSGLGDALDIAAGADHSCALMVDGGVWCWGTDVSGQRGTAPLRAEPTPIESLPPAVELDSGGTQLCARVEDGRIFCWGSGSFGKLGDGGQQEQRVPVESSLSARDGALVLGTEMSCVVGDEADAVWCVGSSTGLGEGAEEPLDSASFRSDVFALAFGGGNHACAALSGGGATCWGHGAEGQIGSPELPEYPEAVEVTGIDDATAVFAGRSRSCVLRSDGSLWCFGRNHAEVLSPTEDVYFSVPTKHPVSAVQIELGASGFACVRTSTPASTVQCWGLNQRGELGRGVVSKREPVPALVIGSEGAVDVSAADSGACMVRSDGTLWCWGLNDSGQLGPGLEPDDAQPTPYRMPLDEARRVAVGASHGCAVAGPAREVFCWGTNIDGELGSGRLGTSSVPVGTGLTNVLDVAVGASHSCALLLDGTVWCWGFNDFGQTSAVTGEDQFRPIRVAGIDDAVAITAGEDHSCVLRATGRAMCFGRNTYGQVGNGRTEQDAAPPSEVVGLADLISISAGYEHTCAVKADGRAYCFGLDAWGEIGIGADVLHAPTMVEGLP